MAASRRRPSARARRQRLNIAGYALWALVAAVTIGGGWFYWWVTANRVQLDPDTLCPVSGPVAVTALLIDRSDPLTPIQELAIRQEFDAIKHAVPRYGALEIYAVNPTEAAPLEVIIRRCNPGDGSDTNPFTGNSTLQQKRWRDGFVQPIDELLQRMLLPGRSDTSPILESIQSVALTAFPKLLPATAPRRLVIVSDMLQHTSGLSHYKAEVDFEHLQQTPYWRKVRADLRGVEVSILYLRRETGQQVQNRSHIVFWQESIAAMGGVLANVRAIEG